MGDLGVGAGEVAAADVVREASARASERLANAGPKLDVKAAEGMGFRWVGGALPALGK